MQTPLLHLRRAARAVGAGAVRLKRSERGIAATEFAIILPVMLIMYLGMEEVVHGVILDRKLSLLARSLGDLTARIETVDTAGIEDIFGAATTVLTPYEALPAKMTVSSVVVDQNAKATYCWSKRLDWTGGTGGTAKVVAGHASGAPADLPAAMKVPGRSLILTEVEYRYTPTVGYVVEQALTLKEKSYVRPRLAAQVGFKEGTSTPKTCAM